MGLKRFLCSGGYAVSPSQAAPRNYYISANGTGDGLTSSTPASVDILVSGNITTADEIYFNRGDSFYLGDFTFPVLNGITIGAYGTGNKPRILGSQPIVGSWTHTGGGIYSKVMSETPKWIYLNGVAQKLAASNWIQSTSIVSSTIIRGSTATLNAFSDLVGAKIRVFGQNWIVGNERTIIAYDPGTGNITMDGPYNNFGTVLPNAYFIIYNQLQHITEDNEWYYNAGTSTLYYKSSVDPSTLDLRAGYKEDGFILTGYNYNISNVEMLHYNNSAIRSNTSLVNNTVLSNLTISDCINRGLFVVGSTNSITGSGVRRCGSQAFLISGANCSVIGNTVDTIGLNGNYPFGFCSAFTANGVNMVVRYNTINNVAYNGLNTVGTNYLIERNIVTNCCKRVRDGGAIYASGAFNSTVATGAIRNNFCYNMSTTAENNLIAERALGIYVDHTSDGIIIEGNTTIGGNAGVNATYNTRGTKILNNVIVGGIDQGVVIKEDTTPSLSPTFPNNTSVVMENNVIASRSIAPCVEVRQRNSVTTYIPFDPDGNADNNHYVQPYTPSVNRFRLGETGSFTNYTLAAWRTRMEEEENSTSRVGYITFSNASNAEQEVKVEMNPTDNVVQFNVPAGYSDYEGNAFSNPVDIQPWTSLAYFKNTAFIP